MKKFLTILMVTAMFGLVACGPTEEEKAAAEAEAEAMVNEMFEGLEESMGETTEEEVVEEETATETEEHEHVEGEEDHGHSEGEEH